MKTKAESTIKAKTKDINEISNPYLYYYNEKIKTLPKDFFRTFDPNLSNQRRKELFDLIDSNLPEIYSWAIPDERALRIIQHYSPIIEMGAGTGYWGKLLKDHGTDIICYDLYPDGYTDENDTNTTNNRKKWFNVIKGGPEVLKNYSDRTLFLCYPDDFEKSEESMGLECLNNYSGDIVIHVGELFGHTLCLPDPWGRTSSPDFQAHLASVYHMILQVPLPSWYSSIDTLTVWKRTQTYISSVPKIETSNRKLEDTTEDSDDDDENHMYAYIPPNERMNLTLTCPDTMFLIDDNQVKRNKKHKILTSS